MTLIRFFTSLMMLAFAALPASAQSPFETVITVNDAAITRFEVDQRARLLTLLRAPGDTQTQAREGLIEDRLRVREARRAGINPTPEEVQEGMSEFAGRANLSADEFIAAIGEAGVEVETFRDFVSAGLSWRTFVQTQFGPRSQVSDAEVDRALSQRSLSQGGVRVLLAEIIVPAQGPDAAENAALIQRLSETIKTRAAFSAAARRYSAAGTRDRGGRLEWLPLGRVPPAIRSIVLALEEGEVTEPIALGPGVGIFQLISLEETEAETPDSLALEYVSILIPGGRSDAARARARQLEEDYDTCDDLYLPAQSMPAENFDRVTLPSAEVPGDIAMALAKLDDNEVSTDVTRQNGEVLVYLMLCGRTLETPIADSPELDENGEPVPVVDEREQLRRQLFSQRLASYSDSLLAELLADAIITPSQ